VTGKTSVKKVLRQTPVSLNEWVRAQNKISELPAFY